MFGFIPTLVSAAPGFKSSTAGSQILLDCAIGELALGVPIIIRFETSLLLADESVSCWRGLNCSCRMFAEVLANI